MIPREPDVPAWVNAVLWALVVAAVVVLALTTGCCTSRVAPDPAAAGASPSWSDYVMSHPYRRALDPAVAHPGWRGARTACGAGKCE